MGAHEDSWTTTSSDSPTVADKFSDSMVKRAARRTVNQTGRRSWVVDGESKFNDAYDNYSVTLEQGKKKYECSCYQTGHGETRRRKGCSHVVAVLLHREANPEPELELVIPDLVDEPSEETWQIEPIEHTSELPLEPSAAEGARHARRRYDEGEDEATTVTPSSDAMTSRYTYPDTAPDLDDRIFGSEPFPEKFTEFRDHQWEAIVEVMEYLNRGVQVVMLSAPTGSGKTLISETVRRLFEGRSVYCCTTKSLQDQVQADFGYARTIKGRTNYPTEHRSDLNAGDCTSDAFADPCKYCNSWNTCPYRIAKNEAMIAPFPVLNIAYFLNETTSGFSSVFRNRELVIIDEADTLENQLMGYIEVVITGGLRRMIGVRTIPQKTKQGKPDIESWVHWLEDEIVPAIEKKKGEIAFGMKTLFGDDDVKKKRQIASLQKLLDKIAPIIYKDDDGNMPIENGWVMTGYEGKGSEANITFKPVRVSDLANGTIWNRGDQFLLMSASFISPAQEAENLGLEDDDWAVVTLDSTFPVENRPVFMPTVAPMTNKAMKTSWPVMAEAIEDLIGDNPNARILIHTVSYKLTRYLLDIIASTGTRMYENSSERDEVLADFLATNDSVLLAPSFERGVDLPGDDCQIIVLAKVPYPYLGDKQISARLYEKGGNGQTWYAVQTIRAIVQMTGRGMRSEDDWCDTFILDSSFNRLLKDHRQLFPEWWREALVLSENRPKYRPLVQAARTRRDER